MQINDWAKALDEFWGHPHGGSRAVLMLEPLSLLSVAEHSGTNFATVCEAETSFLNATIEYMRGKAYGPWHPEPLSPLIPPRFLLQIAVQVYAASKMADDPDRCFTETAYYPQLKLLIGDIGAKERFNLNGQGAYHQRLWRELLPQWAKQKGLSIELPEDRSGAFRHVQLPKSQAVLRIGDLVRLPMFFCRCGLKPLDDTIDGKLKDEQFSYVKTYLRRLKNEVLLFSRWAREVLNDDLKFPVAVTQVQETLRHWDGRLHIKDAGLRRTKTVSKLNSLWIDIQKRLKRARVLSGKTPSNSKTLTADEFLELIENRVVGDTRIELRDGLIVLRYEEDEGVFKQAEYLEPGDRGLIVAAPGAVHNLRRLLDEEDLYKNSILYSTNAHDDSETLSGIPINSCLAELRIMDPLPNVSKISEHWRQFLRSPRARLFLGGGLRIDRKELWVSGAGPFLRISGSNLPCSMMVDGRTMTVQDRVIRLNVFSEPGDHEIACTIDGQHLVKRFSVAAPKTQVNSSFPPRSWKFHNNIWPVFDSQIIGEEQFKCPELFGVRSIGIKPTVTDDYSSEVADRLTVISILSGLSIEGKVQSPSTHPLVSYLLRRKKRPDSTAGVVS